MAHVYRLIGISMPKSAVPTLLEAGTEMRDDMLRQDGCRSVTLWKALEREDWYAVIMHFQSVEAMLEYQARFLTHPTVNSVLSLASQPAEVRELDLLIEVGSGPGDTKIGNVMSMSVRKSDPGLGEELIGDMQSIFAELALLNGYLGSAIGTRYGLQEEVYGVVYWADAASFMSSLPNKPMYELSSFERMA